MTEFRKAWRARTHTHTHTHAVGRCINRAHKKKASDTWRTQLSFLPAAHNTPICLTSYRPLPCFLPTRALLRRGRRETAARASRACSAEGDRQRAPLVPGRLPALPHAHFGADCARAALPSRHRPCPEAPGNPASIGVCVVCIGIILSECLSACVQRAPLPALTHAHSRADCARVALPSRHRPCSEATGKPEGIGVCVVFVCIGIMHACVRAGSICVR